MKKEIEILKNEADKSIMLYKAGYIDRETCKMLVKPYIDRANEESKKIAKKYNQRAKRITFNAYIR